MTEQPQQPTYAVGQVVNGHVWTGTEWLAVVPAAKPAGSSSTWKLVAGIVAFVVAAVAGIQGMYWLGAFLDLDNQGNPFAGVLALLGMAALAVAAGFAIAGIMLVNKR